MVFNQRISISGVEIVNFLKEIPKNEEKATVNYVNQNSVEINLGPNVIATVRIKAKK